MLKEMYKKFLNSKVDNFEDLCDINSIAERDLILEDVEEDTGTLIDKMIRFFNQLDDENEVPIEQRKPIYLRINSPGGCLTSMFTIVDSIKKSKTPVYTIDIGCAYSAGFLVLISGHKRFAYRNSSGLLHEGSAKISSDANKFFCSTDFYKRQLGFLKDLVIENTYITEECYEDHRKDDWYMTAEEMLEIGAIDEII